MLKMGKHTLKILRCEHSKIFKVGFAILHHLTWKILNNVGR